MYQRRAIPYTPNTRGGKESGGRSSNGLPTDHLRGVGADSGGFVGGWGGLWADSFGVAIGADWGGFGVDLGGDWVDFSLGAHCATS